MEQQNTYNNLSARIDEYVKDIKFSASYKPSNINMAYKGYLNDVKGQTQYAKRRLAKVKKSHEHVLVKTVSMREEEWAWEIFSGVVLPMLEFVDE